MGRAPCCDKDKVKRGPWSPEEDAMLKAYINSYGTGNNWIALPQKIGLMRCGKSCRLRWLNYLRPNIKHGGFSEEEDNIISSLYISIGSRWSIIAAQLPGRTDNDIKNYWNTRLKKKLLGRRKTRLSASGDEDPKDTDDNNSLSNSAFERLQLHMQLQNSFSLFSNPVMWPKLNPLQQKMIQTLQSFNDSTNLLSTPNIQHQGQEHNVEFNEPKILDINVPDSTVVPNLDTSGAQTFTTFQAQADDFDCFREMEGAKGNMISWWSNEFELNSNSVSSSSWDSSNYVIDQSNHVMYQEFELGYEAH